MRVRSRSPEKVGSHDQAPAHASQVGGSPDQWAPRTTLPGLTGLRFVAAFWVLLYHRREVFEGFPPWFVAIINRGFVGVSLFFILSGFVLAYNYVDESGLRVDLRTFLSARVARVYPVYLFALAMAAPPFFHGLWLSNGAERAAFIGAALTAPLMLQAWIPATAGVWNSPGWSLSDEAFFYLLFPLLVAGFFRIGFKQLAAVALSMYVLSAALGLMSVLPEFHGSGDWIYHNPALRLPEFVVGVALGCVYNRPVFNGLRTPHRWMFEISVALMILTLIVGRRWDNSLFYTGILAPFFVAAILGLASNGNLWAGLLNSRLFVLLGEGSYALYLLHKPIWKYMTTAGRMLGISHMDSISFTALYGAICIVASIVVLRIIEEPARRGIRAMTSRPRPSQLVGSR